MLERLAHYKPIAEAISILLYPYAEVVIHDLKTDCIAGIFNNFSKRKEGDESLLQELKNTLEPPDVFPIYFKTNLDGRKLKCVTATLKDQKGIAIALLCINLDVSKWEEMGNLLLKWVQEAVGQKQPEILFKDDWRERVNIYVSEYLKKEGCSLKSLNKKRKRDLVLALHREGAFSAKNASHYIADVLEISRATIYNYLRSE